VRGRPKFPNLMPFGCWWFSTIRPIVSEVTRERLELLGASFIAQHSDARVLGAAPLQVAARQARGGACAGGPIRARDREWPAVTVGRGEA